MKLSLNTDKGAAKAGKPPVRKAPKTLRALRVAVAMAGPIAWIPSVNA